MLLRDIIYITRSFTKLGNKEDWLFIFLILILQKRWRKILGFVGTSKYLHIESFIFYFFFCCLIFNKTERERERWGEEGFSWSGSRTRLAGKWPSPREGQGCRRKLMRSLSCVMQRLLWLFFLPKESSLSTLLIPGFLIIFIYTILLWQIK